jgi:hypothetical protein
MKLAVTAIAVIMATAANASAAETRLSIEGPRGPAGTLAAPTAAKAPIAIIIPGSGPTDRDGNNPLGVTAGSIACWRKRSRRKACRLSVSTSAACSAAGAAAAMPIICG